MTDTASSATPPTGGKALIESKTFWANFLALAGLVAQTVWGFVIPAEWQVAALGVLNVFLRLVTKDPIAW